MFPPSVAAAALITHCMVRTDHVEVGSLRVASDLQGDERQQQQQQQQRRSLTVWSIE